MKTSGKRNSVLLVGDSFFIHNEFADICQKHGYDIISVGSDPSELQAGIRLRPNIILVDYTMKNNDPYLVIAILHNALLSSYIALVDGHAEHCNEAKAKSAGAHKVLCRSCDAADYEAILHGLDEEIYL